MRWDNEDDAAAAHAESEGGRAQAEAEAHNAEAESVAVAGRGEGLAGLREEQIRVIVYDALKNQFPAEGAAMMVASCCAEPIRRALEAAAPAGTAHNDDEPTCRATDSGYICTLDKNHSGGHEAHGFSQVWHKWPALATPSPQAPQQVRWTVEQNGRSERILCRWYEKDGIQLKREVAVFCDWNAAADMKWDEEDLVCTMNDYPRALAKSICAPAATQEQPASAPLDILASLDREKYTGPAGKIMQVGSPRKVGEDAPVTRETLEHWLRAVKSTLDPDGWDCGAPELRRMREQIEFALSRSSSVPVGEQKERK